MAVERELARACEQFVEAGRHGEVEEASVLASGEQRAKNNRVVVSGGLAVNPVGAKVGDEIAVELADCEITQLALLVERRRKGERGQEQAEELERAVIPLRRQIGAHISGLRRDSFEQPRLELQR